MAQWTQQDHTDVAETPRGHYVMMLGERMYCISDYDTMDPFFITLTSSSDHWLFISTTGGLTAGRRSADHALFPYYTVDRVAENADNTGAKTLLWVSGEGADRLWEPFSDRYRGLYRLQRNLYKNITGTALVFEEGNHDLGLTYRYAWRTSPTYGFIRTSWLVNNGEQTRQVRVIDGLQNVLPAKVNAQTQNLFSVLIDAYKRSELVPATGLGLFTLSSQLTDLAEPSEALRANTVWQVGLDDATHLLSSRQLDALRDRHPATPESDVRGHRGAYLVSADLALAPGTERTWHIVAEVGLDSADVIRLNTELAQTTAADLTTRIEADIADNTERLTAIGGRADGLQTTGDDLATAHHFANVMFNVMRGGVFADGYTVDTADFRDFVTVRRRKTMAVNAVFFDDLPDTLSIRELKNRAAHHGDRDLIRLCTTYLPLTFSRRHGDPSRPWNRFAINLRKPDGSQQLDYQGNWRDIFQNWEALAFSYPDYLEGMVGVFLDATTVDGYNPYRVTRDGIEWEIPEPDNPWANIGYWSDHQIIYLLKLLEALQRFYPDTLTGLLTAQRYAYAHVPYRIKPYDSLLDAPYSSIEFDWETHQRIEERVAQHGTDGRLVLDQDGQVVYTTLAEKLLNLLLAKLVNFVPGGGIWMNTQRPEWNDANNALAGRGLSVVTLGYLLRYVTFFADLLARSDMATLPLSHELAGLYTAINRALVEHESLLTGGSAVSPAARRRVMDALGQSGSDYRWSFYENGLSGQHVDVTAVDLAGFMARVRAVIEATLRTNRRDDDLYHAYNVLDVSDDGAEVQRLTLMLEGQVSILSSGLLAPAEALRLLRQLRASALYRADQHSYMLYPDRRLPGFLEKNVISRADVAGITLAEALIRDGNPVLLVADVAGDYHFNGDIRNAEDVRRRLAALAQDDRYADLVAGDSDAVLALFERTFNHSAFTGRSGSFFAYEGLGSIYWHMVSKLLLAVQEAVFSAAAAGADHDTLAGLIEAYYDVRAGLGYHKSPEVYGAFPTDPYSHSPGGRGAKQPGMTGMVKEEILTRMGELGIVVVEAQIGFDPLLVRGEWLDQPTAMDYYDVDGVHTRVDLPPGAVGYTFCQVPIVLMHGDADRIEVTYTDGKQDVVEGCQLSPAMSEHIFTRDGVIRMLNVILKRCTTGTSPLPGRRSGC